MRSERRKELVRILRAGHAHTQNEIADALRDAGHEITQATVSRDLRAIGATKLALNGEFVYRLPDEMPRAPGGDLLTRSLLKTLAEFAIEIKPAASIVIVTTEPGHASAVARAIDLAGVDEVAGTVAGDDTIFVATPGDKEAARLSSAWWSEIEPRRVLRTEGVS